MGVTYCKQGGSGSSDRICPPIQGERENRDGANGSRAILWRGIYEVRLLGPERRPPTRRRPNGWETPGSETGAPEGVKCSD
jgi:hypothetical protein